ncbi:cytochrome c biogenesis CcdA family protein [Sphingomonas mali]|uniref:cytochrome c biogenesis CcdA family protein n=1 Tax=Sphingomonas mali TaxID=40682 RepID=UPI0008375426|nr:cytochrome c biogenesis CcdA family protein [Sphingomonas mali]
MSALNPVLAFAAGALTILSPCVLPLVPIVLASAAQKHRLAPLALSVGLVASFTLTGVLIAALGATLGIDSDLVRLAGAVLLIVIGLVLLVPLLRRLGERGAAPIARWAGERQAALERFGLAGQAAIGALLGLVWSPCVGPTLGAATVLAAQGRDLGGVLLVMASFGLGIASVLLALALSARTLLNRWRGRLMEAGDRGRKTLGVLVLLVGLMIVTGADHWVEGVVLDTAPPWLTSIATSV